MGKEKRPTWSRAAFLIFFACCYFFSLNTNLVKFKNLLAEEILPSESYNIVTIAGGGASLGEGGPATAAQLSNPRGLVVMDSTGNLYFAEGGTHRVRRIDSLTGTITTVAGNGTPCPATMDPCGDGGPATGPTINNPYSVVLDASDNLYISEFSGNRVRKVDGNGIITRIAGTGVAGFSGDKGKAVAAQLRIPRAINFDSQGILFIPDGNNHRIRKVDGEMITTVAGTGDPCTPSTASCGDGNPAVDAQLNGPHGLAFDSAGNMYIDDTNAHRVRKIDTAGIITTLAGTGEPGSAGDEGPAGLAQLNQPRGVALDSSDNLYISESFGHRIRKVGLDNTISRFAGTGEAGFSGDGGPALAAKLNGPRGVNFDPAGNLYIADSSNNRLRRLNLAVVVDVAPDTLNITKSKGKWVTAYIQLPAGWDASAINVDSVRLQAIDPVNGALRHSESAQPLQTEPDADAPTGLTDTNEDGVPDQLMLKYDRATVASWTKGPLELVLRVEGQFNPPEGSPVGKYFSGDTRIHGEK